MGGPEAMIGSTGGGAAPDGIAHSGRWRRPLAIFLTIVAPISLVLAVTGTWMHSTLFDTEEWVEALAPLPDDPEFRDLVATEVAGEVTRVMDLEGLLSDNLGPLGGLLGGTAEQVGGELIESATRTILESPKFDEIWADTVRRAHENAVAVLRDEADNVSVVDGNVLIDVLPLVNNTIAEISQSGVSLFGGAITLPPLTSDDVDTATDNLARALGVDIPPDFGRIPVFEEDALDTAQIVVRVLEGGRVALWVIFALSFVGSLAASRNRRRTVAVLGSVSAFAAAVVWLVRDPVERSILAEPSSSGGRRLAELVIDVALWRNLGRLMWVLVGVSVLAAAVAFLVGPSRSAVAIRRTVRGVFGRDPDAQTQVSRFLRRHRNGFRIAGAVAAVVAMVSLPRLTWAWFIAIMIVLGAYEVSFAFVRPLESDEEPGAGADDAEVQYR